MSVGVLERGARGNGVEGGHVSIMSKPNPKHMNTTNPIFKQPKTPVTLVAPYFFV